MVIDEQILGRADDMSSDDEEQFEDVDDSTRRKTRARSGKAVCVAGQR